MDLPRQLSETVGLCASCVHSRQISSRRGSVFWLCQKSETDPRFPKYPPLPVRACTGYEATTQHAQGDS